MEETSRNLENFRVITGKPESPWHGPAPLPPAQKVLSDEIDPK